MKNDPLVKLLISAYQRGRAILAEREKVKQSAPTKTKIAGDDGDSGTRNTDNEHNLSYHENGNL
jgi:hypothetical protein